jgi:hypothetical protein
VQEIGDVGEGGEERWGDRVRDREMTAWGLRQAEEMPRKPNIYFVHQDIS